MRQSSAASRVREIRPQISGISTESVSFRQIARTLTRRQSSGPQRSLILTLSGLLKGVDTFNEVAVLLKRTIACAGSICPICSYKVSHTTDDHKTGGGNKQSKASIHNHPPHGFDGAI